MINSICIVGDFDPIAMVSASSSIYPTTFGIFDLHNTMPENALTSFFYLLLSKQQDEIEGAKAARLMKKKEDIDTQSNYHENDIKDTVSYCCTLSTLPRDA